MCHQRRLKSACASAQSNPSVRCPFEETLHPWLSKVHTVKNMISLRILQMHRLIWIFTERTCPQVHFLTLLFTWEGHRFYIPAQGSVVTADIVVVTCGVAVVDVDVRAVVVVTCDVAGVVVVSPSNHKRVWKVNRKTACVKVSNIIFCGSLICLRIICTVSYFLTHTSRSPSPVFPFCNVMNKVIFCNVMNEVIFFLNSE